MGKGGAEGTEERTEREAGSPEEGRRENAREGRGRKGRIREKGLLPMQGLEEPDPAGTPPHPTGPHAYRAVTLSLNSPHPICTGLPSALRVKSRLQSPAHPSSVI